MADIKWHTSRAGDVETGILVQFDRVVTVPVTVDGREAVAYIGTTRSGALAHQGRTATRPELVKAAKSLAGPGHKTLSLQTQMDLLKLLRELDADNALIRRAESELEAQA